jgi:hypothetical protein
MNPIPPKPGHKTVEVDEEGLRQLHEAYVELVQLHITLLNKVSKVMMGSHRFELSPRFNAKAIEEKISKCFPNSSDTSPSS